MADHTEPGEVRTEIGRGAVGGAVEGLQGVRQRRGIAIAAVALAAGVVWVLGATTAIPRWRAVPALGLALVALGCLAIARQIGPDDNTEGSRS
ncbi:MAG: hypothetical protein ACOCYZ_00065 [Halococcoides sp.]